MLTVTERAAAYLRERLSSKREGLPQALRIVRSADTYDLMLDDPREDDEAFTEDGQTYLLIGAEITEALEGAVLDVQEGPQGPRITLTEGAVRSTGA